MGTSNGATGIVLAGGRSERFGSDKMAALYHGVPLLHHAVLRVSEVTREVIVVLAPDAPIPAFPPGVAVRTVRDAGSRPGTARGSAHGPRRSRVGSGVHDRGRHARGLHSGRDRDAACRRERSDGPGGRPAGRGPVPTRCRWRCGWRPPPQRRTDCATTESDRLRALPQALRTAVIDEATWHALDPQRRTLWDVDEPADLADR